MNWQEVLKISELERLQAEEAAPDEFPPKQGKQIAGPFNDKEEASSHIMFETDHLQRTSKKYIALEKNGQWFVHENGEWKV